MKSIANIFLIFTIIYTTIGVRINVHHCETKNTTNYSISENNNCCSKKSNSCPLHQENKDCCSDHIDIIHLGQDIHFSPYVITPNSLLSGFILPERSFKAPLINRLLSKEIKGRAPPLIYSIENRQALHQVYII